MNRETKYQKTIKYSRCKPNAVRDCYFFSRKRKKVKQNSNNKNKENQQKGKKFKDIQVTRV